MSEFHDIYLMHEATWCITSAGAKNWSLLRHSKDEKINKLKSKNL